jgi:hypothetical protein
MVGDYEFGGGTGSIGDLPNAFGPDSAKDVAYALEEDQRFILGHPPRLVAQPFQPLRGPELLHAHIGKKCFEGFVATLSEFEISEVFDRRLSLRVKISEKEPLYISVFESTPRRCIKIILCETPVRSPAKKRPSRVGMAVSTDSIWTKVQIVMLGMPVGQKTPLVPLRDVVIVPVSFVHRSNMVFNFTGTMTARGYELKFL